MKKNILKLITIAVGDSMDSPTSILEEYYKDYPDDIHKMLYYFLDKEHWLGDTATAYSIIEWIAIRYPERYKLILKSIIIYWHTWKW